MYNFVFKNKKVIFKNIIFIHHTRFINIRNTTYFRFFQFSEN